MFLLIDLFCLLFNLFQLLFSLNLCLYLLLDDRLFELRLHDIFLFGISFILNWERIRLLLDNVVHVLLLRQLYINQIQVLRARDDELGLLVRVEQGCSQDDHEMRYVPLRVHYYADAAGQEAVKS